MQFNTIFQLDFNEADFLRYVSTASTILSTATVLFILPTYYFLRKRVMNFFWELEMLVIIAYLPLLATSFNLAPAHSVLCSVFGALRVYSSISILYWQAMFVRTVQTTVKKNLGEGDLQPWKMGYLSIALVPGIISAIMPFTGGGYVSVYNYCWIDLKNDVYTDWFVFLTFYMAPKLIGVMVVIAFTIDIIRYLKRYVVHKTSMDFRLILIYVIVCVLFNPIDISVRIYATVAERNVPFWLGFMQISLRQLQGFFYCLVFLLSPNFRKEVWNMFTRKKANKVPDPNGNAVKDKDAPEEVSMVEEETMMICDIFKIEGTRSDYHAFH